MKKACIINLSTQDSTGLNPNHNACDTDWLCLYDYLVNERSFKVDLHNPYARRKLNPLVSVDIIRTDELLNKNYDEIYLNFQPYHIYYSAGHGIRPFMINSKLIKWLNNKNVYCLFLDSKPGSMPPIWEYSKEWEVENKIRKDRCNEQDFYKLKNIITNQIKPIFTNINMADIYKTYCQNRKFKIIDLYNRDSIWDYILKPFSTEKFLNLSYVGYNITNHRKERLELLSKGIENKKTFGKITLKNWSKDKWKQSINAQDNIDIMASSKGQIVTYDIFHPMITLRIYQSVVAQSLILIDNLSPQYIIDWFINKDLGHQIVENNKEIKSLIYRNKEDYKKLINYQNKVFNYV